MVISGGDATDLTLASQHLELFWDTRDFRGLDLGFVEEDFQPTCRNVWQPWMIIR